MSVSVCLYNFEVTSSSSSHQVREVEFFVVDPDLIEGGNPKLFISLTNKDRNAYYYLSSVFAVMDFQTCIQHHWYN